MEINLIVFDLDGTLIQSDKTIYHSALSALNELNIPYDFTETEFNSVIGHHFKDMFSSLRLGIKDLDEFINVYKSYYYKFIDLSVFYPNVIEVLETLKKQNYKIALLTTKMQDQADRILSHFEIDKYFDLIMGRRKDIGHKPSPEPLQIICNELKTKPGNTIIVGDTDMDIQCGKNAGAFTCAVTFGYRNRDQLEKEEPDYIIDNMENLLTILKG